MKRQDFCNIIFLLSRVLLSPGVRRDLQEASVKNTSWTSFDWSRTHIHLHNLYVSYTHLRNLPGIDTYEYTSRTSSQARMIHPDSYSLSDPTYPFEALSFAKNQVSPSLSIINCISFFSDDLEYITLLIHCNTEKIICQKFTIKMFS